MKLLDGTNITLGTCYYPEHWDRSLWADDLARMKEAGLAVVRVAEFAWSKIEPREGEYMISLTSPTKWGCRLFFRPRRQPLRHG